MKLSVEKERSLLPSTEVEKLRQQMIDEMHEDIKLENYNLEQQILLEEKQMEMRKIQLKNTWTIINKNKDKFEHYISVVKEEKDWVQYMKCNGLSDSCTLSDMNTDMFIWSADDNGDTNMNITIKKCKVIIYLLLKIDELIEYAESKSLGSLQEWKIIRQKFRNKLQNWINQACYHHLRHIERDMVRVDMKNAVYVYESTEIISCLWVLIKLPISLKVDSEKDRKPIEVQFKEIGLTIKMPLDIQCYCMVIRSLWTKYDHISDTGLTYRIPDIPKDYQINSDLLAYCENIQIMKKQIREEQAKERKEQLQEKIIVLEKLVSSPITIKPEKKKQGKKQIKIKKSEQYIEPKPLPHLSSPDEIIIYKEGIQLNEDMRKELRKHLYIRCEKAEINLRKYKILGGIYHIDLIHQPPQPKDVGKNIFLTILQVPKELKHVPFSKEYHPPIPVPDDERTPEVIEEEIKALEAAMEALVLVTLKLPDSILWLEPPLVAHWISERKIWSTQYIHDIKYNEEEQIITFRTRRLGIHGLAMNKLINLPFQSWELKPESGKHSQSGVILNIVGAVVQVEFIIRENYVCLSSLVGGASSALRNIIGQFMEIKCLVQIMQNSGCDLFPEQDAFCYMKNLIVKHSIVEKHLQECIGLLCTAYSFSWSRWNATRSHREIIVQCKELRGCVAKERTNRTLLITPTQTMEIQCSEVSQEFSALPSDGDNAKGHEITKDSKKN